MGPPWPSQFLVKINIASYLESFCLTILRYANYKSIILNIKR